MVKIKTYLSTKRLVAASLLCGLFIASVVSPVHAQNVPRGYTTEKVLQKGMIVSLETGNSEKVVLATSDSAAKLHGVVVDPNDSSLTLSSKDNTTFVATNGKFSVLVSDQEGPIRAGEFIAVGAIAGVGMAAGDSDKVIIGKALSNYEATTQEVLSSAVVKDSEGRERTLKIGRVDVDIAVAKNPNIKAKETSLPEFLRKSSEAVAGKPVSAIRVYLSLIIVLITTIITGSLLYGGIRSSLISIGRNPLSKRSIWKSLLQVSAVAIIVFLSGLAGAYVILNGLTGA
jgi:hypothetical protein